MDHCISSFFRQYVEPEVQLADLENIYHDIFIEELLPLDPKNLNTITTKVYKTPLGSFFHGTYGYYPLVRTESIREINVSSVPPRLAQFLKEHHEDIMLRNSLVGLATYLSTNAYFFHEVSRLNSRTALFLTNIIAAFPYVKPYVNNHTKPSLVKIQLLNNHVNKHPEIIDAVNVKFALGIYPHPDIPF